MAAGAQWRRSWWIALTFVPFGWLAFVAFAYVGRRARRRDWIVWAIVYAVVSWTATIVASIEELDYGLRQAGGLVMFFGTPVPIVHALVMRRAYLDATSERDPAEPAAQPPDAQRPDRGRHRWRGVPVLMALMGLAAGLVGGASLAVGEPLGISFLAMGAAMILTGFLRAVAPAGATPVAEPVPRSGETGLVFRYSRTRARVAAAAVALFMVAAVAMAVWPEDFSPRRAPFARPAGIAAAVAAAITLGSGATGRAGGVVALTPTGITNESGSFRTSVAWDDVRDVRPATGYDGGPVVAVDATGRVAVDTSGIARARRMLSPGRRRRMGHVTLDPRALEVEPAALLGVLRHYWGHPEDRRELGSARAVERYVEVAKGA